MRADRLLSIMLLLQTRGKITTQMLADELGVSRRTILRDVEALSMAGIPIYTDGGHGGGVSLDENYRVRLTGLKEAEVRALVLSSNASLLADVGLGDAAENTLLKLLAALPSLHQQAAQTVRERIYIDPVWWWHGWQRLTYLSDVQRAVFEDRRIKLNYQHHDGTVVDRELEAYGLVAKASVWYLVAAHDGLFRTYRVSRMDNVEVLDEHFTRQPDFDLVAVWENQVREFLSTMTQYVFTLDIANRQRNFVTWYAPGFQEILESSDERFIARFEVESLELARMFVLGLGADARIIEPDELREAVRRYISEIASLYAL